MLGRTSRIRSASILVPAAGLFPTVHWRRWLRSIHVRDHESVLKRLALPASAFNLGLLTCWLFGIGTPRTLQGHGIAVRVGFSLWTDLLTRPMDGKDCRGAEHRKLRRRV